MNDTLIRAKEYVKLPMDRVGVLIGPSGEVKKSIEERTQILMNIDSKTGTIEMQTTPETQDPLAIFRAKAICEAIGLGFSPPRAFRLFNQDELLKIIDLAALLGKRDSDLARIKGRVIGEGGKARTMIEELTGARISIYENTVAIIGTLPQLRTAEEAINMLIDGAFHKSVYQFLYKKRKELKQAQLEMEAPKPPARPVDAPRRSPAPRGQRSYRDRR